MTIQLIAENTDLNFKLYRSRLIVEKQQEFINELNYALEIFRKEFPEKDSTWTYRFYNVFCLTSASRLFYDLLTELKTVIREYAGHNNPLWLQAWINYHEPHQLLDWHDHDWSFHGYISIDPKQSATVFDQYKINNEVGNIYIGPGKRRHKVETSVQFDTPRITLGFDVLDHPGPGVLGQFSLMPI